MPNRAAKMTSHPPGPPAKVTKVHLPPPGHFESDSACVSYAVPPEVKASATHLSVFARLPASCPFVGNFHYAPSAGNRAYSFFEGQIVPYRETERLHKIRTNPLTGNFHSRPGHYSRLHGLHNFRRSDSRVSAPAGEMRRIIECIKTTLTEPSSSAAAEATERDIKVRSQLGDCGSQSPRRRGRNERAVTVPLASLSASDMSRELTARHDESTANVKGNINGTTVRRHILSDKHYHKYWEAVDTERGRFGVSIDDNAIGSHHAGSGSGSDRSNGGASMSSGSPSAYVGIGSIGKSGVHWGKHHHHHGGVLDSEKREPLIGDATAKLRHLYFQRREDTLAEFGTTTKSDHNHVVVGSENQGYSALAITRRSMPDIWKQARALNDGRDSPVEESRRRSSSFTGQGWESHTLKAQQETEEYMQGREDLAPDMRPSVVLDKQVSEMYDVDVSESNILGSGAYGTVFAAVHRSTGRQVAIKTMLKKYLFSDAEKASVEREIEIQKRLVNNHIIRLYEMYQTPEKLYLVLERAPCGTLEDYLYVRGRMKELDAKRLVRQLLDGVAYLHKIGIVHCDLKPANILFSDIDHKIPADGPGDVTPRTQIGAPLSLNGLVVKICDFGHARKVPDCRYYKFTGDINKIPFHLFKHTGTDGFVAPEVLTQKSYGKAADMWSTGCMLYKMLSGRMPWVPSRACLQRPLSMNGAAWNNISTQAKSLVRNLLHPDQVLRANVEQATHHAWLEGIHHCAEMPTSAPGGRHALKRRASIDENGCAHVDDGIDDVGERPRRLVSDGQAMIRPSGGAKNSPDHRRPTATTSDQKANAANLRDVTDRFVRVA